MANTKLSAFTEKTSFDDNNDIFPLVDVSAGAVASATKKVKIGTLLGKIQDGSTIYAASSAGTDTYAITVSPTPSAYANGQTYRFKADVANTGAATLNVNSLGAVTIKKNNDQDLSTNDIEANQIVEVTYNSTGPKFQMDSQLANAGITTDGTETITGAKAFTGNSTHAGNETFSGSTLFTGDTIAKLFAPQGFLINGKISPTVSGNNLTVAIKTLAGGDPSATDPVYVRIGDTVRAITAALSVTANAGTNWCNSGSSELATKEIDYFVYLGYNATDGVVIGFSRLPGITQYGDFSATSTNERYCRISTITTAASTDYYEVIGRFAATLSAGAGYTWTVPTFTAANLIQRPIYETRLLTWSPTWTGYSASPSGVFKYRVLVSRVSLFMEVTSGGTSNATTNKHTVPFAAVLGSDARMLVAYGTNNSGNIGPVRLGMDSTATFNYALDAAGNVWTSSGTKSVQVFSGFTYEI